MISVKQPWALYQSRRATLQPFSSIRCEPLTRLRLTMSFSRPANSMARPVAATVWTMSSADSVWRSEEHTSELQSLMRISYAVFCLKKKKRYHTTTQLTHTSKEYTTERQNKDRKNTRQNHNTQRKTQ